MVKIRLRRIGTKARPFYRVVVTPSTAGRNGRFVETIGTYDPVRKPVQIEINEERAMHWLLVGAQPTETTARLLNKVGVLDRYFSERPSAKKEYSFLDKRTAAMSVQSVMAPAAPAKKAEEASAPAPVAEAAPIEAAPVQVAPVEEAPVVEAVAEEVAPAAVVEEAPGEAAPEPEAEAKPEGTSE